MGDLDHDGKLDLLARRAVLTELSGGSSTYPAPVGTLFWLSGNGDGTFQTPVKHEVLADRPLVGDFHGAGDEYLYFKNATSSFDMCNPDQENWYVRGAEFFTLSCRDGYFDLVGDVFGTGHNTLVQWIRRDFLGGTSSSPSMEWVITMGKTTRCQKTMG